MGIKKHVMSNPWQSPRHVGVSTQDSLVVFQSWFWGFLTSLVVGLQ